MRKYTLYVIPYAEFTRTHVYIVHIISQLGGYGTMADLGHHSDTTKNNFTSPFP